MKSFFFSTYANFFRIDLGRFFLSSFFFVFPCSLVSAQAAQKIVIQPKPVYQAVTVTGPNCSGANPEFDSPQETLLAVMECWNNPANAYYRTTASNLRPDPNSQTYSINGIKGYWLFDYVTVRASDGQFYSSGTTTAAVTGARCPTGFQGVDLKPGPAYTIICTKTINEKQDPVKNSCPAAPNPVYGETGLKLQREDDFIDSLGVLSFSRTWRSDYHRFFYSFESSIVDSTSAHSTGGVYLGFYQGTNSSGQAIQTPYYFSSIGDDSGTVQRLTPNGDRTVYSDNGAALTAATDIDHKLSRSTDAQGNSIWITKTSDDITETYDSDGRIIQRRLRGSRSITYQYSDSTTPISIAPRSGLVISMNDDNSGRSLKIAYNTVGNLSSLTDPAGNIVLYTYDEATGNCPASVQNGNCQRLTSVTYPGGKKKIYHYNEASAIDSSLNVLDAYLTGITDENGARFSTYKYDAQGRAISSGQGSNNYSLSYGTNTTSVADPFGTTRTYDYQTILGRKRTVNLSQPCSSGCGTNFATTYDANGNISSRTDFNGSITNYAYDLSRNLEISRNEANGTAQARTITTQWHATYRLPTLITEPGKTTAFNYDPSGNLLTKTITDTALNKSRTWAWTNNSLGQVLTADGPRTDVGDLTVYSYYATTSAGNYTMGDLATATNALGQVTQYTQYDANGRPLSITDPNNVVTTLTYTPRGWLKTKTVDTQTTIYDYDGVGQVTKITQPDGSYLLYVYDTAHRLTDISDNNGNKTHYTLDAMGNRTKEETFDPSNAIKRLLSREYDALNRLQKDIGGTDPATQITQYSYDNNGNIKTITDPLNHVTTNGYDALNRLITVTDPANGVATTTYNALDQVTQVKDARLVATNYTIDALGNVTLTQSPDSGATASVYDAAGNVTQKTDARGVVSNYTYDALNRVTSITYPASTTENVSFTYDSVANGNKGIGRLTGYSNDGGATALVYDAYGNVITQTEMIAGQFHVTAYQYDTANRVTQITYPSGRVVLYGRNAMGQITSVHMKDSAAAAVVTVISAATYEPFGPLKSLTYGNGVTSTMQHDADYRTSRITTTSTPAWDFQYSYDAADNLTGLADQISTNSKAFGYDALDRVVSDTNNTGAWTYQYDANGNRTKRGWVNTSNATTTQTLTYSTTSNRLTKNGSATQTVDAAGNITGNGQTLAYSHANHLSQVSSGSTVKASFLYNALNQRTAKLQISKPMHFQYGRHGELLGLALYNGTPLSQRNDYLWLDDTPIAQVRTLYTSSGGVSSRRTTFIHADHLNTPRVMTDSTKKIVWRWDGDAYAAQKPNENPDGDGTTDSLNLRFPGQFNDAETLLFYNWNRYYDPATGRYVPSDPIQPEALK